MGKLKKNKFRFHKSTKADSQFLTNGSIKDVEFNEQPETAQLPFSGLESNIFAGVNINFETIAKSLHSEDTCSLSGKSRRELKKEEQLLPKKEKMNRRHERFMQKLEVMYAERKKLKKKKASKPTGFEDVAPLLTPLSKGSDNDMSDQTNSSVKKENRLISRPCMKAKRRKKADKEDVRHFSRVINDPVFRSNPSAVIAQFLKQKVAKQRPDLEFK